MSDGRLHPTRAVTINLQSGYGFRMTGLAYAKGIPRIYIRVRGKLRFDVLSYFNDTVICSSREI